MGRGGHKCIGNAEWKEKVLSKEANENWIYELNKNKGNLLNIEMLDNKNYNYGLNPENKETKRRIGRISNNGRKKEYEVTR